ncbi:hypothetical protein ACIPWF_22260 [Paenarthrobacter sp. NPDC089989]|uniref:hypothetical protein n=1 Tax=unclassified Paenarthrobacter TaxID=2634190 RepID=UPI003823F63E
MTKPEEHAVFEKARELEGIIAEGLWGIRPDSEWDIVEYVVRETGSRGSSGVKVYLHGQEVDRIRPEDAWLIAALKLREVLYRPQKGTWLSMSIQITPKGGGWEVFYNYYDKPNWDLGEPSADSYAQELYLFPRDDEHIPDWFREEMKGATWTPEPDEDH